MESGQIWDRSTPTYMWSGSLFMFFSSSFFLAHKQLQLLNVYPISNRIYSCVYDMRNAQIAFLPREDCLLAPRWMSGFPRGRQRSFEIFPSFGAVWLCASAHRALCYIVHTHIVRCWLYCLLPAGHKLIIHTLSHQCRHTVILTFLRPAGWIHVNVCFFNIKKKHLKPNAWSNQLVFK